MIVIHPGSRFTRIGRACDVNPITVPSVVARKLRGGGTVPNPAYVKGIERPQPGMERTKPIQGTGGGDEYSFSSQSNDPVSSWLLYRFFHFPPLNCSPGYNSLRSRLIRLSRVSESE